MILSCFDALQERSERTPFSNGISAGSRVSSAGRLIYVILCFMVSIYKNIILLSAIASTEQQLDGGDGG